METPPLSVIMPVRDAAGTLKAAIESALAQSFEDFELLLIDDGSVDGSREILEAMAREEMRISVLETAPGLRGIVPAHCVGVAAARGALLGRMDSDDVSHPERFERQVRFLGENRDVSACGCGVSIRRRGGGDGRVGQGYRNYETWLNSLRDPDIIAAERFVESPLAHAGAMIRRDDLIAAGGYRESAWAEDYDLWLRMLEGGMRLANLPEVLLEWWDSDGRMTRVDGRYAQGRFLEAKAHYLARLEVVKARGVAICGAGPTGKRLGSLLREAGIELQCFVEVHPRRIGQRIGGAPVVGTDGMPVPGEAVAIGAVGLPGGRLTVRQLVTERGFVEGVDFFAVA